MAVEAIAETRVVYSILGDTYEIPFPYMSGDLGVAAITDEGTPDIINDYTATGGNNNPGTLVLTTVPTAPYTTLMIWRRTPLTQELQLDYNEGLSLQLLEAALDKLTRALQDATLGQEALRFPITENTYGASTLPASGSRINSVLYFNSAGSPELLTLASLKSMLDAL